jgi:DnaK suppressor protein
MLNDEERGRVERALLRERARTLENIGHFDERLNDLRERAGELSLYRFHPADVGTESQEQEKDFLLTSVEGRRLYQLDEALDRLYRAPESYDRCSECGREIAAARLEVVPEARLCAQHARQLDEPGEADSRESQPVGDPPER